MKVFGNSFCVCVFAVALAQGASFSWTGTAGDGAWSSTANWEVDGSPANRLPGITDDVFFSNLPDGTVIDVDMTGSVKVHSLSLSIAAAVKVTFGGDAILSATEGVALELAEGSELTFSVDLGPGGLFSTKGNGMVWMKGDNRAYEGPFVFSNSLLRVASPYALGTTNKVEAWQTQSYRKNPFQYQIGSGSVYSNELIFLNPLPRENMALANGTQGAITNMGKVTVKGQNYLRISGKLSFGGGVEMLNGILIPDNIGTFFGAPMLMHTRNWYQQSGPTRFDQPVITDGNSSMRLASVVFGVENLFQGAYSDLYLGPKNGLLDLNGYSQRMRRFRGEDTNGYQVIKSDAPADFILYSQSKNAAFWGKIQGAVNFILDDENQKTFSIPRGTHTTTGSVTVQKGNLLLGAESTWRKLSKLASMGIGEADLLEVETDTFSSDLVVELGTNSLMRIADGVELFVCKLVVAGESLPRGTYSGTEDAAQNVLKVDQLRGTGRISVLGTEKRKCVWTGAAGDGKWSSAANWEENRCPLTNVLSEILIQNPTESTIENDLPSVIASSLQIENAESLSLSGEAIYCTADFEGVWKGPGLLTFDLGLQMQSHGMVTVEKSSEADPDKVVVFTAPLWGTKSFSLQGPASLYLGGDRRMYEGTLFFSNHTYSLSSPYALGVTNRTQFAFGYCGRQLVYTGPKPEYGLPGAGTVYSNEIVLVPGRYIAESGVHTENTFGLSVVTNAGQWTVGSLWRHLRLNGRVCFTGGLDSKMGPFFIPNLDTDMGFSGKPVTLSGVLWQDHTKRLRIGAPFITPHYVQSLRNMIFDTTNAFAQVARGIAWSKRDDYDVRLDINGYDQTVQRLYSETTNVLVRGWLGNGGGNTNTVFCLKTPVNQIDHFPVVLTNSYVFALDGAGTEVLSFAKHPFTGVLDARLGTLSLRSGASFDFLREIRIQDGVFEIPDASVSVNPLTVLTVFPSETGKLRLGANVTLTVGKGSSVDGKRLEKGRYAATSANGAIAVDFMEGDGVLVVDWIDPGAVLILR